MCARGGALRSLACVAVFDSGVGGLTVLHECLVSLPHEDFVYLGDTARFPYGDRAAGRAARVRAASSPSSLLDAAGRSCSWWPATRPRPRRCRRCEGELDDAGRRRGRRRRARARLAAAATHRRPRRAAGHAGDGRAAAPTSGRSPTATPTVELIAVACPSSRR